jgi:acetoin utilization protein AcuB
MIVSMWMTRDVVTIEAATPIIEAAAIMAAKKIRRLPVVEKTPDGLRLKGIVSATDILHAFPPHVNPFAAQPDTHQTHGIAADIMSRQLLTTTMETPIEEAARQMRDHKIGALPVIHDGHLAGLITESDIFRVFVSLFEHPNGGLRITFGIGPGEDVFSRVAKIASETGVRVISLLSSEFHDRTVGVVLVTGKTADEFLEALRASAHRVLNVVRLP